jgi:hypothetical protein
MKKTVTTLSIIGLFALTIKAQTAPDFGFETWNDAVPGFVTVDDPAGWASLNALTISGSDTSVIKSTVMPAAGTGSARIKTIKVVGPALPNPYGGTLDTAGILVIGKITVFPTSGLKYGYSYTNRSAVLTFQSKYTPVGNDSAFVLAYFTKWNGVSRDTIASGKYATGATTASYAANTLTMNYKPAFMNVLPDSQQVFVSSSVYSHDGAQIGSTFYIDALAWSGWVSTNDIDGVVNSVSLYPNPANNNLSIECSVLSDFVEVLDIAGRKIGRYSMHANKVNIETTTFAKGMYIYQVIDSDNKVINRGKFEVAH